MRQSLFLFFVTGIFSALFAQESNRESAEMFENWITEFSNFPSLDSIGNPDLMEKKELDDWANQLVQQSGLLETGFARELSYATYKRENLQTLLLQMRRDKTTPDSLLMATQNLFVRSKNVEKSWKTLLERAEKSQNDANRLTKIPVNGVRNSIANIQGDIERLFNDGLKLNDNSGANAEKSGRNSSSNRQKASKSALDFRQYKREEDPLFNPPAEKCHFAFQGRDEMTGEQRFEIEPELFFTFTNNFMKNHLRDRPHIIGNANLVGLSNGKRYLNLMIQINESSAKKSFGGLNAGNRLTIKFIDGSFIMLENARTDEGVSNETDNFTTFRGTFFLDKDQLNAVSKREIDRIRLAWNTGFEDYEIYNVDVLVRQSTCLFK